VELDQQLSSATATAGDTFGIRLADAIHLTDGAVIPAGFHGKGEVVEAHKKGMLGKAGELSVRLEYIRIGDVRLRLRANKSGEGKDNLTTTIVLTVLLSPLFLMHHGSDVTFAKGQSITAYADEDTAIPLPVAAPPQED
jgi:hypothetical protein